LVLRTRCSTRRAPALSWDDVRRRLIAVRRAFGQTRWGRAVRQAGRSRRRIPQALPPNPALLADAGDARALAAALASPPEEPRRKRPERALWRAPVQSVLLISHSDFTGNSALHALKIGSELHERGLETALAVSGDPDTVDDVGRPPFPILSYREARMRNPDLVHAFTPRERVRRLATGIVTATRCPYVVHLEDNDAAILAAELGATPEELEELPAAVLDPLIGDGQVHPLRGPHFVEQASGVTVVIEPLLELVPQGPPAAVVRPGVDEALLASQRDRSTVRAELDLAEDDFAVVYTGTVHRANAEDMRTLYDAVAALRRDGHPVVLVKTGWTAPDAPLPSPLDGGVRDLGWVPRSAVAEVIAAGDVLVQPGRPGPFNDYRFPAKLPEFLASGRPVVLTRTNLGRELRDGEEALVLDEGTTSELARAIVSLRLRPGLAERIGAGGRAFALRELRWSTSADRLQQLYGSLEEPPSPEELELPPPVRVVAGEPEDPGVPLRRRVLQALARGQSEIAVDAAGLHSRGTRRAVREGVRRYYASRGLNVSARAVARELRSTSA
jgi:glycosyltransferase involved in cell wall biosynthesis